MVDAREYSLSSSRLPSTGDVAIIHEVYDSENAQWKFENELELALDRGYKIIVIEPSRLGDETARWIAFGNCLHKTAIISGLSAVCTGLIWERPLVCTPLGVLSLLCSGLYTVSWQFDPCCKYQVERNHQNLPKMPILQSVSSTSPVVLVRRDDGRRKILHSSVSVVAALFCIWQIYSSYK
ncbi:Transmembrane protein 11-A, mitochondrial [Frankliniella fusca]|uniref:Transmembrane protein 11-A, mitochondrial n=1 Tax=Frankliniella fusca TaxID=407009 RepID=A0AAE1L835_9NEOP|nr:Transmembrane protein 11-A, mitochondrial [Frankliniella fusca]